MNLKHVWIVWRKELLDTVRDRRTLVLGLVVPVVVMPLFMLGPSFLVTSQLEGKQQEAQSVAVVNADDAPGLAALIRQSGTLALAEPADPAAALEAGEVKAILVLPDGFEGALAGEAELPQVLIRFKVSDDDSDVAQEKLTALLDAYRQQVVRARLESRGLPPELTQAFTVARENVASEGQLGGFFLSFLLPFFLVLWAAVGGSQTAIDVSAGEKERNTLEALLVTPPGRSSFVVGKFLTILTVTLASIFLSLSGILVSLTLGKRVLANNAFFERLGFQFDFGTLALMFAVIALLAAMMSALTFTLYAWTRSFKEAQSYASYISFVAMIPAMLVSFLDAPTAWHSFLLPIYSTAAVIKELLLGEMQWPHFALNLASSAAYAVLALALAIRVFQSEKVMFRK